VATVCGCPDEGRVDPAAVIRLAEQLLELGTDEISLGDTLGVGHPAQVRELVRSVASVVPLSRIALHLHDTYGRALANVQAGLEAGVRVFDASLGGLGGCPYAPGASGNHLRLARAGGARAPSTRTGLPGAAGRPREGSHPPGLTAGRRHVSQLT
jgi:hydroxymethylglutaryl-CoA lyase